MRSPFLKGESSFEKSIHSSKRVNGRVNRVNQPSKGEWVFALYTLAVFSNTVEDPNLSTVPYRTVPFSVTIFITLVVSRREV